MQRVRVEVTVVATKERVPVMHCVTDQLYVGGGRSRFLPNAPSCRFCRSGAGCHHRKGKLTYEVIEAVWSTARRRVAGQLVSLRRSQKRRGRWCV
jgi:hypothetical protein